ncbi:hypothetical protein FF36_04985 [Frankia torreyi]|uniref:Uncharacterized protein n=1 Tax=Frankia torreyi TaxID=1856 RepID=A0A0D8B8W2_9ACTN|nr:MULTISPECIES: hypothetical protein [Frankia]KJE20703.1 hypothetical protein FF36_04985 [Frankia torreyi]KQC39121.1 hypothetical protein UK82_05475 [Frankia sp. ACN1ag]
MPGFWDATIKAVYAADSGTNDTINVIDIGKAFDVVADVEVGGGIISFGGADYLLSVVIRNQSTFSVVFTASTGAHLPITKGQTSQTVNEQLRLQVPGPWNADDGDVLDVLATFKVTSGNFVNITTVTGSAFLTTS